MHFVRTTISKFHLFNRCNRAGLIEIITIKETGFIDTEQLPQVEKFVRFYYDLDINLEGIETISHLLKRIYTLQNQTG